jgi:AICAR transformylase/IMP cyclohydrolase PurH
MVVVNLYQFEKAIAKPGCTLEDAIENIDIGGPTLLRASAKNYRDVTVVVDPADYPHIMDEMKRNKGATNIGTRFNLARTVFKLTHEYDGAIYHSLWINASDRSERPNIIKTQPALLEILTSCRNWKTGIGHYWRGRHEQVYITRSGSQRTLLRPGAIGLGIEVDVKRAIRT